MIGWLKRFIWRTVATDSCEVTYPDIGTSIDFHFAFQANGLGMRRVKLLTFDEVGTMDRHPYFQHVRTRWIYHNVVPQGATLAPGMVAKEAAE